MKVKLTRGKQGCEGHYFDVSDIDGSILIHDLYLCEEGQEELSVQDEQEFELEVKRVEKPRPTWGELVGQFVKGHVDTIFVVTDKPELGTLGLCGTNAGRFSSRPSQATCPFKVIPRSEVFK